MSKSQKQLFGCEHLCFVIHNDMKVTFIKTLQSIIRINNGVLINYIITLLYPNSKNWTIRQDNGLHWCGISINNYLLVPRVKKQVTSCFLTVKISEFSKIVNEKRTIMIHKYEDLEEKRKRKQRRQRRRRWCRRRKKGKKMKEEKEKRSVDWEKEVAGGKRRRRRRSKRKKKKKKEKK